MNQSLLSSQLYGKLADTLCYVFCSCCNKKIKNTHIHIYRCYNLHVHVTVTFKDHLPPFSQCWKVIIITEAVESVAYVGLSFIPA